MKLPIFFLFLMYLFNIISVISIIFIKRDNTGVKFAWLLVFLFLPYIGFIFYFFCGSTYRMRVMSLKYGMSDIEERYTKDIDEHIKQIEDGTIQFNEEETKKYKDMIIFNSKNAMSFYTQNNNVELLVNGEEKFPRLFKDIEEATESIDVLYFIIKAKDNIGKKFISLLANKAREGLKVKLIYDGIACLETHRSDFDELIKAGGKVYRFLPSMVSNFIHINYQMHRKIVIVDGEIAYTGGINVGDEYFILNNPKDPWRDTSIRLTGTSVLALQIRFWADLVFLENQKWSKKRNYDLKHDKQFEKMLLNPDTNGNAGVQIVSSGPSSKYEMVKDSYVKMISSAKKYLYLQTPYFIPDQILLDSLRIAAISGVDVRVMLPGIPDKKIVYNVTLSYVEELLSAGIKVYFYSGFIHAKTMVMDDHVSTVGTTNMDIRSFKLDYEVNAFIYNTTFALKCRDTFMNDIERSKNVDIKNFFNRSLWNKICESISRFIAPLA